MKTIVTTTVTDASTGEVIRFCTGSGGFDDDANRLAVAEYFGVPVDGVTMTPDSSDIIYLGKVVARITYRTQSIDYL